MSDVRVADDEERVTEPLELVLERVGVERIALDHEDGAVAVLGELLVHRLERQGGLLDGRLRDDLTGDGGPHAADDLEQPCAAGVDDAGLLQDREQIRRPRE